MYICIYVYIYIEGERHMYIHICVYIYIYIYMLWYNVIYCTIDYNRLESGPRRQDAQRVALATMFNYEEYMIVLYNKYVLVDYSIV